MASTEAQAEQVPAPVAEKVEQEEVVIAEDGAQDEVEAVEEAVVEVKPITIRLPNPSFTQTLPKSDAKSQTSTPSTLVIHPQSFESMQDVRATLSEWIGGYWLGPYSLRIPGSGATSQVKVDEEDKTGRGKLLGKGKESVEVRVGEKLSDWLEVGEVFGWADELEKESGKDGERVLVVQREAYSESDARQAVLRLREYTMQATDATLPFQPIGLNGGASVYEGIRDGTLFEVDGRTATAAEEPQGKLAQVKKALTKAKGGKPPVVEKSTEGEEEDSTFLDWKGWVKTEWGSIPTSMPAITHPPCYRSLVFSPFNPPPAHLRQRGHLLYATVMTLEGESMMLVCTTKGWHVARSTAPSSSFDPAPRAAPKELSAHSLVDLMHGISPLFTSTLRSLQNPVPSSQPAREPIASAPIPQHAPAYPWLADQQPVKAHTPDMMRTQLAFGYTGAISVDSLEGARDWNEELQNAREMPRASTQERVLRERVLQKTHTEFTAACIKGTMAIARGDLPPINPHEDPKAHMWLANNIFFTKGVNSVDAYTHLGGDDAAHVSHAKDAMGVKLLNKLDVDNVYLLGHTVVDWQGERWVCQSVLPGIFSRRREDAEEEAATDGGKEDWVKLNGDATEEAKSEASKPAVEGGEEDAAASAAAADVENYLIIYGADSEGGTSKLHWDAGMHKVMGQIASAQHLASHKVTDGKGKEFDFWTSADVKGLRGSDGRRYLLDLPRLSPVDIEWLEKDLEGSLLPAAEGEAAETAAAGPSYPHRVTLLRPELIDSFWEHELKVWARKVHAEDEKKKAAEEKAKEGGAEGTAAAAASEEAKSDEAPVPEHFELRFNADAFVEQAPPAGGDSTKALPSQHTDETDPSIKAVRDASVYLRTIAIPGVVIDFIAANTFGILDGASLSKHLHTRGVNIRYLGHLLAVIDRFIKSSEGQGVGQLQAIKAIALQEMVFRASKHILRGLLNGLSPVNGLNAVSHFLNCLLGSAKNADPVAEVESFDFAPTTQPAFASLTPASLRTQIVAEVARRFRWKLDESYLTTDLKKPQLLRELALRTAFQLIKKEYDFSASAEKEDAAGTASEDDKVNGGKAKKSKKAAKGSESSASRTTTFEPSDILTLLPVVKACAPTATVAEEVFETGRNTISRGNTPLGLELMLEGINMYEQIHQVVHPEVASAYNQYAVTLHQLVRIRIQQMAAEAKEGEEEPALGLDIPTAIKLQRQAIMAAERTVGLDNAETIGYYFNLAMLENLQGDYTSSMRYFKHVIALWDVTYGSSHPELPSTLIHVAMILQAQGKHAASITVLNDVHRISVELYGEKHLLAGSAMNQLTQAHFLNNEIEKALECAKVSSEIFNARLGEEDAQSKEAAKNVELLSGALEHNARVAAASQQQLEAMKQLAEQKQANTAAANQRRRQALASAMASSSKVPLGSRIAVPQGATAESIAEAAAAAAANGEAIPQADVDKLVEFIQGGGVLPGAAKPSRGKQALRGKRRTGAKR